MHNSEFEKELRWVGGRLKHPWISEGERLRFGVSHTWPGYAHNQKKVVNFAATAECLGFDSFWLSDHPTFQPDCWTMLAAIAMRTHAIRLGTLVTCALYRHPVMLAGLAANVDGLSEGRFVLGLGSGDFEREFRCLGIPFGDIVGRQAALEDLIVILRTLWQGGVVDRGDRHHSMEEATITSRPCQEPYLPILIAGGGEQKTLKLVALYADISNFGGHESTGKAWTVSDVTRKCGVLRAYCNDLGRPPDSILRSHWAPPMFIARTKAKAASKEQDLLTTDERLRYGKTTFVGTPEDAVAYYESLAAAGINYFVVNPAGDEETLELIAMDVIPALRSRSSGSAAL